MQFTEGQLNALKQILEVMNGGSNIFTPQSKFNDIKTFTDSENNLYISYLSTTPTIDGFEDKMGYMSITPYGTIEYLSLIKNEKDLEELYKTLIETKI
jgi:hypothetical protein